MHQSRDANSSRMRAMPARRGVVRSRCWTVAILAAVALAVTAGAPRVSAQTAPGSSVERMCSIRVVRTSAGASAGQVGNAVVRATVTDQAGKPMVAAVAIRAIGIGTYTDGVKGVGTFVVPQNRISSDSMVVSVSWWGYLQDEARVLVAPGDTIMLAASLCSAPREPVIVRRPAGSPESPCLGPDAISQGEIRRLQRLVRSLDTNEVSFRRLVHIPAVPDSMVMLVTDGRICRRVVRAWAAEDSTLGASPPYVSDLYVIRIGPVFVATIPAGFGSHYQQYVVYDSTFTRLAPFLW